MDVAIEQVDPDVVLAGELDDDRYRKAKTNRAHHT